MTGKIDGSPETFLFISTLNGSVYNTPGPTATILVEDLQPVAQGSSEFEFLPIFQVKTQSIYDDANEALLHELNIPLPDDYSLSQ